MVMSEEEKSELRRKIVKKLNERYEETAANCKQVQEQYVAQLESEAEKQTDQTRHGGAKVASLTIREILEMERSS